MAFLSSETLKELLPKHIEPFDIRRVMHCAYELSLGRQYYNPNELNGTPNVLKNCDVLKIPPGQFAILISEESIRIPSNMLGFISIKAGIKFRGLVNVSGFHVDPGFEGRLKFTVYNAGANDIFHSPKEPIFLLWLSTLDKPTKDIYGGKKCLQDEIKSDDVSLISGTVVSRAELKKKIDESNNTIELTKTKLEESLNSLSHKVNVLRNLIGILLGAIFALIISLLNPDLVTKFFSLIF